MHSLKTGDPPYILPPPPSAKIYEQSLMIDDVHNSQMNATV